ncbi:MAG: hypothetical protein H5U29_00145 [Pusillimonas sp.]|nr:hypothetical protein [Pusillimonas sp.]
MTPAQHAFFTDQKRKQCEAKHVLSFPTKAARREYLGMVEKRRGELARKELEAEIMKQWKEGQH